MMIFVESNFVIELAALQQEAEQAELLVQGAESREIKLLIPAFCLTEPFETYVRWRNQRNRSRRELDDQLRQLARSQDHAELAQASQAFADLFSASAITQTKQFRETLSRLIRCASVLPLNEQVVARSLEVQDEFGLEPQDAVVFASVETGLREAPDAEERTFVTKDRRGFIREEVTAHFKKLNCSVTPGIGPAIPIMKRAAAVTRARPA